MRSEACRGDERRRKTPPVSRRKAVASKELKVTRERVRQIEADALAELRRFVQAAGTDLYEAFRATVGHGG